MKLIAITIYLFSLINLPQRYNDRRILVITALENTTQVRNQIDILQKNVLELKERSLAVFILIDEEITPIINTSKNSKKFIEKNKAEFTTSSMPKTYLIGLDKNIKQTFTDFVNPQQIFEIVDLMPMRKAKMRRN